MAGDWKGVTMIRKLACLLRVWSSLLPCSLLLALPTVALASQTEETTGIEVLVEWVERITRGGIDGVEIWLKVNNESDRVIFMAAGLGKEPRIRYAAVDQWQLKKKNEWEVVWPCLDTPPPSNIKLKPGESVTSPLPVPETFTLCKRGRIPLEGKFRVRVKYFDSEQQWQANRDYLFEEVKANVAVSGPFEIPPASKPK